MKLLILGATGATGRQLVSQALDAGHEVTVLVRSPEKLGHEGERVTVRTGDATDPAAMEGAVDGTEAVLSALGTRSPKALLVGTDVIKASAGALVPAMDKHGVRRVIWLSALGVGPSREQASAPLRILFSTMLRQIGKDKVAGEERLSASGLDWTLVYPPTLTDGPRTAKYRAGHTLDIAGVPRISRADVADFMLAQLSDPTYSRKTAIVSSP
jgi:putative NADH-flavin reductase